ncbi:MAG: hypothetical protein ABL949_11920 [Fimbriimonadaceae bacterium]
MQGPVGFDWFGSIVVGTVGGGGNVGTGGGEGGYTDPGTGDVGHGGGGSIEPGFGGGPSIAPVEGWEGEPAAWETPGISYEDISHWGHMALDGAGVVDQTGLCDIINSLWYSAEGNWEDASISLIGAIPAVGDFGKVGKYGDEVLGAIGDIPPPEYHHLVPKQISEFLMDVWNVPWDPIFEEVIGLNKEFHRLRAYDGLHTGIGQGAGGMHNNHWWWFVSHFDGQHPPSIDDIVGEVYWIIDVLGLDHAW